MAAVKPKRLKLGSKPDATTTPSTTGMSAAYTEGASRLPMMMAAIAAVKKGVVEPIACAQRQQPVARRATCQVRVGCVSSEGGDVFGVRQASKAEVLDRNWPRTRFRVESMAKATAGACRALHGWQGAEVRQGDAPG